MKLNETRTTVKDGETPHETSFHSTNSSMEWKKTHLLQIIGNLSMKITASTIIKNFKFGGRFMSKEIDSKTNLRALGSKFTMIYFINIVITSTSKFFRRTMKNGSVCFINMHITSTSKFSRRVMKNNERSGMPKSNGRPKPRHTRRNMVNGIGNSKNILCLERTTFMAKRRDQVNSSK